MFNENVYFSDIKLGLKISSFNFYIGVVQNRGGISLKLNVTVTVG